MTETNRHPESGTRRIALVGTGNRCAGMFLKPLINDFGDVIEIVALCDPNPKRAAAIAKQAERNLPIYTDFGEMMATANPDGVIVASRDCTHAEYIVKTLQAGKHVFSEKPVCTTVAQCHAIRQAGENSAGRCLVTHNMRYGAATRAIYDILRSGKLGDILFIRFEETLDRCHGADYFRRWHRYISESGGLMIHKASHHFDALNWLAGARPATVSAIGRLAFYGKNGPYRHTRCRGCPHAGECPFYVDVALSENYTQLYLETESEDGYMRDACVFDPSVDIYDQMNVLIGYENNVHVSYSLTAYSPYESETLIVEGTMGRLEYRQRINTGWSIGGQSLPGIEQMADEDLKLYMAGQGVETIQIVRGEGSHGGSDPQLREDFFRRDWALPPTPQMATLEDAVQAVLVGTAANTSIRSGGQPVDVQAQ